MLNIVDTCGRSWKLRKRWFDGGGNGIIYGKEMNAARQRREHFSFMGGMEPLADNEEGSEWV